MIPWSGSSILSVVLIGTFVLGLVVFEWRRGRARGRLARLARRRHLSYMPVDSHGLRRRLRALELIRQGHNRHLSDIVAGSTRVGPVYCFRYRYERGIGVDRRSHRWTVSVLERDHAVNELCLRHPDLPDGRLGDRYLGEDRGVSTHEGKPDSEGDSPGRGVRVWFEALDFPAVLECRNRLISLQAVDDGSDAQYEYLLATIEEVAERMEKKKEEGKREEPGGPSL